MDPRRILLKKKPGSNLQGIPDEISLLISHETFEINTGRTFGAILNTNLEESHKKLYEKSK